MKSIFILCLINCFYYCTSQYVGQIRRTPKSPCDGSDVNNKNALVEHFFNTIFTEFFSSPPICVCVQMCPGHFTYCYPNGCLKTKPQNPNEEVSKNVEGQPSSLQKYKNKFTLTKDDTGDLMTDLLEKYYQDDTKLASAINYSPLPGIRPDVFKNKYSYGHYKRIVPKLDISNSLKDKVRSPKYDTVRFDSPDLAKSRWPMHKQIVNIDGRKRMIAEENPVYGKPRFFTAMLPDSEVVEYPPKYFKRDTNKNTDSGDVNLKAIYVLEDALNVTEDNSYSLAKLIDALIRSTFRIDVKTNEKKQAETESKMGIEKVDSLNMTSFTNETMKVISMNFTDENVNKNKYFDETPELNNTGNLTEMITYLTKQIEKQNNTTMEIAKIVIDNFNATTLHLDAANNLSTESNSISTDFINVSTIDSSTYTAKAFTESTNSPSMGVTKKNQQRIHRKLPSSKIN